MVAVITSMRAYGRAICWITVQPVDHAELQWKINKCMHLHRTSSLCQLAARRAAPHRGGCEVCGGQCGG